MSPRDPGPGAYPTPAAPPLAPALPPAPPPPAPGPASAAPPPLASAPAPAGRTTEYWKATCGTRRRLGAAYVCLLHACCRCMTALRCASPAACCRRQWFPGQEKNAHADAIRILSMYWHARGAHTAAMAATLRARRACRKGGTSALSPQPSAEVNSRSKAKVVCASHAATCARSSYLCGRVSDAHEQEHSECYHC